MREISPIKLQQQLQQENIFLLDVREPHEHEEFNIGGTLLPLDELITNASVIPRHQPVIIYCKKGIRSQIAIQRLEDKFGFTNLVNLKGGMEAWKREIV